MADSSMRRNGPAMPEEWLDRYPGVLGKVCSLLGKEGVHFLDRGNCRSLLQEPDFWPEETNQKSGKSEPIAARDFVQKLNDTHRDCYGNSSKPWKYHVPNGVRRRSPNASLTDLKTPDPLQVKAFMEVVVDFFTTATPGGDFGKLRQSSCSKLWPRELDSSKFADLCNIAAIQHGAKHDIFRADRAGKFLTLSPTVLQEMRQNKWDSLAAYIKSQADPGNGQPSPTSRPEIPNAWDDAWDDDSESSDTTPTQSEPAPASGTGRDYQVCSAHGKKRSAQNPESDGNGGMRCAAGFECKIGSDQASSSKDSPEPSFAGASCARLEGKGDSRLELSSTKGNTTSSSEMRWHRSLIRGMSARPRVITPVGGLRAFQELAPTPEQMQDFPISDNGVLRNFVQISLQHRIDMHRTCDQQQEDQQSLADAHLDWFGIDDGDHQEVCIVMINSKIPCRKRSRSMNSSVLLMFVPETLRRSRPDLDTLWLRTAISSSDLPVPHRMKQVMEKAARQVLGNYGLKKENCVVVDDEGEACPPLAFEDVPAEELQFSAMAKVNADDAARHLLDPSRSARIPPLYRHLTVKDMQDRIAWSIQRARTCPNSAVPQYFVDKNSEDGGCVNLLIPLSLEDYPSTVDHLALVLCPQKSPKGKVYYNCLTALPLRSAFVNALVVNPLGSGWLNMAKVYPNLYIEIFHIVIVSQAEAVRAEELFEELERARLALADAPTDPFAMSSQQPMLQLTAGPPQRRTPPSYPPPMPHPQQPTRPRTPYPAPMHPPMEQRS